MLGYFDDLIHIGTGLRLVHDAAKPWDRRSPERLGINAQVDDLFHGRSDTGGPRAHAYKTSVRGYVWSKLVFKG